MTDSRNHEEYNNQTMTREIIRSFFKGITERDLYTKPNILISRELRNDFNIKIQHNYVKLI